MLPLSGIEVEIIFDNPIVTLCLGFILYLLCEHSQAI